MRACPACGFENADDVGACARCRLATELFEPVGEFARGPESDPQYLAAMAEILRAVGEPDAAATEPPPVVGRMLQPARFLGIPAPTSSPPSRSPRPPETVPQLPALPRGDAVAALRRQVDDLLQIGRRQGINLTDFSQRARDSVLAPDRDLLEALNRDLFVHIAAALTEEYEELLGKREEIAQLIPTPSVDAELESCRWALSGGDLAGAQRRMRHIRETLGELEDQWATVQILVAESELLAETIRELGGDPSPGLGPLDEGRRLARGGGRAEAEPVLARAALGLWTIASPLLVKDLLRLKDAVLSRRAAGADVAPALSDLRDLSTSLRHRNFASAVSAYRRLRASLDAPDAPADVPAAAATGGPGVPTG